MRPGDLVHIPSNVILVGKKKIFTTRVPKKAIFLRDGPKGGWSSFYADTSWVVVEYGENEWKVMSCDITLVEIKNDN